jgi:putative salt-induced outer membrane protein YdiY
MRVKLAVTGCLFLAATAMADTVTLKNGDVLNGTIGQITSTEMKFKSAMLPELIIELKNVEKYQFDAPKVVQPKHADDFTATVTGDSQSVKAGEQVYSLSQIKSVNPPPEEWKGAVVANFALARGNTNRYTFGVDADAVLRRDNNVNDDRTSFGAEYHYGQTGGGPSGTAPVTDTDNWLFDAKYDRFWTEKLYGYVNGKVEHDRIALLYYRVSPGVGLGYQWFEGPRLNFNTEAGFGYVREEYDDDTSNDYMSVRFAYHLDSQLSDRVSVFHNVEYLPAIDDPSDYTLNADVGLRATLSGSFFTQFKIEYKRDSQPAAGSLKNDLLYTIGVGWQF